MSKILKPLQGVRVWKNDKNKFLVFELHYTADPSKRSEIFLDAVKSGLPIQKFLQEYEIQWDTYQGMPVYQDFNKDLHKVEIEPYPEKGLPLLLGWDFGLTPACIIGQLQDERLVIIKELTAFNMGIQRFASLVRSDIALNYPFWSDVPRTTKSWIDPSGYFKKDTDESTCAEYLIKAGFSDVAAGPVGWEERRTAVEHFLTKHTRTGPGLTICAETASVTVRGFEGGYHYPENAVYKVDDQKPVKNEFSHPHDALQYLCAGVLGILSQQKRSKRSVPTPSYHRK